MSNPIPTINDTLQSHAVTAFLEAARSFCLFVENEESNEGKAFIKQLQKHLLSLYTTGMYLPEIIVENNFDIEIHITQQEQDAVYKFICQRIPFQYYWVVLNQVEIDKSPHIGTGDLIDDVFDIYKDVKRDLLTFDSLPPAEQGHAIWSFKFHYSFHWKDHCIDALNAVHHYLYDVNENIPG